MTELEPPCAPTHNTTHLTRTIPLPSSRVAPVRLRVRPQSWSTSPVPILIHTHLHPLPSSFLPLPLPLSIRTVSTFFTP